MTRNMDEALVRICGAHSLIHIQVLRCEMEYAKGYKITSMTAPKTLEEFASWDRAVMQSFSVTM